MLYALVKLNILVRPLKTLPHKEIANVRNPSSPGFWYVGGRRSAAEAEGQGMRNSARKVQNRARLTYR